jgi:hypothetical protein
MTVVREEWLLRAGERTAAILKQTTGLAVPRHYVSVGFPKGAKARGNTAGQCWDGALSSDRRPHLFLSPVLSEPLDVLAALLHEQIHAAVGPAAGHRHGFVKAAKTAGLLRPWVRTTPGPELSGRSNTLAVEMGAYPHAALTPLKESWLSPPAVGVRLPGQGEGRERRLRGHV